MNWRAIWQLPAYYLTLLGFAAGGLELGAFSLLCGWLPATAETERFFQRLIHEHFRLFHGWCAALDLVHVSYRGFERLPPGPVMLVANHLSLIDITCLLARVPEALCIFKPAIRRNPILGPSARRAGYLGSDGGHELVRGAVAKLAAGHTLVIFPEGTRAPIDRAPLPLKPGFVVIARLAQVPIQLLRITTDSDVLAKGRAWWQLPRFPAHVEVTVGPRLAAPPKQRTEEFSAAVESWYRTGDTACVCAFPAVGN